MYSGITSGRVLNGRVVYIDFTLALNKMLRVN